MQQCDKPGGPMHEVIRRTLDELNVHNYYGVITIVSQALAGCERVSNDGRPLPRPSQLGDQRSAVGVGVRAARIVPTDAGAAGTQSANSTSVVGKPVVVARGISAASLSTSTNLNSTTSATASTTQNSNLTTPPKAAIAGPSAGAGGVGTEETRHVFNQTQILRLLLLRAEAFSNTKQHEKALQDAIEAVEVSQRQSAEAYFTVGREQRKLFRIPESVAAFDIAQALLRSIGTASSTQVVSDDGSLAERPSDAEFFAARGFTVDDVRRLGVTRREFEYQESQSRMIGSGEADTPPTSSSATPVAGGSRATFGATPSSTPVMNHLDPMAFSTDKQEISLPSVNSTPRNQPTNVLAVTDGDAADAGDEGADPPQGRCGMSLAELSMWRRLARESRALASMRVSRTVPSSVLETAMTLLDRRVSAVRGALTIAVENCTSRPLRLVGCLAPSAMYIGGFYFPDLVTHSSCGVGLIQPKGWSGYSGVVCYEVDDAVCCMCYFDCPLLSGLKCGVRFVGLRSAALRKAFTLETGCHVPSGGIAQDQAITPPNPPLRSPNCGEEANITVSTDTLAAAVKAVKTQPPGAWSTSHTVAIKGKSRTVKVACRMVEGSRSINFTVMEAVPIRLRSVELLTALEYGGAPVLKKLSAVNRRYRQLVNNLPPPLFFSTGAARRAYPDYCIPADLTSSPFTIRDREPVTWKICFESRIVDQEELVVVDETDPSHTILAITCDTQSWVTGTISYGDKRSPLLSIKESWNPFNKSVFVNAASGRTFARCNNTQGVFSFHVGNDTSGKLTEEPHFTVQRRANPAGRDLPKGRLFQGSEIPVATPGAVLPPAPSAPPSHANNLTPLAARAEHYTVWRPHKESGGNLVSSGNPPARTNSGSDIAAELKCYVLANAQTKVKNICLVEMKIFPGADALLVAALAFCIHRW